VSVFIALLPLAFASPVDPSEVAGLWDAADLDDLVLRVLGIDGAFITSTITVASDTEGTAVDDPERPAYVPDWRRIRSDRGPPSL
jgi:hypothetical protein